MNTVQRPVRNQACAIARFSTPCDFDLLENDSAMSNLNMTYRQSNGSPTSVSPTEEPAPGSGGAHKQKSSAEFTRRKQWGLSMRARWSF